MIADIQAPTGSKEKDLAWQVERVWCDDEDITDGCFYFDTDANIALCYDRNEQGLRFKHPGEAEAAKIIKIGTIKYQLRKGEYRTFEQSQREQVEAIYDPSTGQVVTTPTFKVTLEEVQTVTRDEDKMITVDRILVDAAKEMADVGYIADQVFPLLPVDDPKDPDIVTMSFKDDPEVKWNGDMTITLTLPPWDNMSTLRWWKDDDERIKRPGMSYFIANTVA